ncbi:hypothetical protein [Enterococcus sp. CWB-B31]|uniref:hypothetical protein n=1 Tax=Enterococcus sp. CWB-B31 TaxID=2885159 RepID=UPI001E4E6E17|nr:hypothetical protein [Enterococcus sp. CWB-B31]MCB5954014.1 hypothetical protein [Enterococcus sp. CWB-B31]
MKKLALSLLVFGVFFGLSGCGTSTNEGTKETASSLVKESTEDTVSKEDKNMKKMEEDLADKGVKFDYYDGYLWVTREKSIDYDYFEMIFKFSEDEIFQITLGLKGNIDGNKKDDLYYEVSQGRIVESSIRDTDIDALAEVLESIGYSDKELLEFAQWYYENNK